MASQHDLGKTIQNLHHGLQRSTFFCFWLHLWLHFLLLSILPHWPFCCSFTKPAVLLFQGFCTCCSLWLEDSFPRHSHNSSTYLVRISVTTPSPQKGLYLLFFLNDHTCHSLTPILLYFLLIILITIWHYTILLFVFLFYSPPPLKWASWEAEILTYFFSRLYGKCLVECLTHSIK